MAGIILSLLAQQDLGEIFDHLDSRRPHLSDRFAQLFDQACKLHLGRPMMGASCEEFGPGLRYFTVWNYATFYRPTSDGMEIARILHAARNLPEFFG